MSLRPARHEDCTALAQLNRQSDASPWSTAQFECTLAQSHNHIWLAENNNQITGFIVWQTVLDESELHLIATAPDNRRQGIASQLLNQLIQAARTQNVSRIFLEVRAGNHGAQAFYHTHGFSECGRRKHYYPLTDGSREDAVLMEKSC